MRIKKFFFSIILIPVSMPTDFVHLKYEKIKENTVSVKKQISIEVNSSASPLFYKLEEPIKLSKIDLKGRVEIERKNNSKVDDSYFQLGIIYQGDYRPSPFIKPFLPEWLLKVLSINDEVGVGSIFFHEASMPGKKIDKEDSVRSIQLKFITQTIIKENKFSMSIIPNKGKVLGFWFRVDGDESKSKFTTIIEKLKITE